MNPRSQSASRVILYTLLGWVVAAARIWLAKGWGISQVRLGSLIQSDFMSEISSAAANLFAGFGCVVFLVMAGCPIASRQARFRAPIQTVAASFLVGTALAGTICAVIAFWLINKAILGIVGPAVFLALWHTFRRTDVKPTRDEKKVPYSPEWLIALIAIIIVLVAALAPPVESDGLRYHLVTIQEWGRAHSFVNIPYNSNSNLPSLGGLIIADSAFAGKTGSLLQLLQWANFVVLIILSGAFARQLYRSLIARVRLPNAHADSYVSQTVVLMIAGIPVVGLVASWPFADVCSAAPLVGAAWAFTPGSFRSRSIRVIVGGLLAGVAIATKISNVPIAGLICAFALFNSPNQSFSRISRDALIIAGCLFFVMAPWLLKNWIYHHNPVYPLAYGIFGGPEWSAANDAFYKSKLAEKGLGHDFLHFLRAPLDITTLTAKPTFEQQNPGPAFLALLPACLLAIGAIRKRRVFTPPVAVLIAICTGYAIWFKTYQSVRFLMPVILLSVILGIAALYALAARLEKSAFMIPRVVLGIVGLISAIWLPSYLLTSTRVLQTSLGFNDDRYFMTSRFPAYTVIDWLNKNTRRDEPVFYIGEFRAAYADHYKPIASDWFDTPRVLVEIRATENNDALLARWREQGIRYVLMNLKELGLYEAAYFRPRFTDAEWKRFSTLRESLLQRIAYDNGDGIFVAQIGDETKGNRSSD
ncbi:MAG: hypothetical protein ABI579_03615 [Candidatus Sumerlaeota bacterium]